MVTVMKCSEFAGGRWPGLLCEAWQEIDVFFPSDAFLAFKPEPLMEDLCRELESAFSQSSAVCQC